MKRVKRINKKIIFSLICLSLSFGMVACDSKDEADGCRTNSRLNLQSEEVSESDSSDDRVNAEEIIESETQSTYPKVTVDNALLGITLDVIDGMGAVEEYLVCNMDGVSYVIGDTDAPFPYSPGHLYDKADKLSYNLYTSYSIHEKMSGQEDIGGYMTEFAETDTKLSSSTKTLIVHNITYVVSLERLTGDNEYFLLINIASENTDKLEKAKAIAKEIICSIRKTDKVIVEETDEDNYLPKEYRFPIDIYYTDKSAGYENTVMLIDWTNVTDEPEELVVIGPERQRGVLNEKYSMGGHYLYEFGKTSGGEYYIHGGTETKLLGARIVVSSMEWYLDCYHYYEIHDELPDYILNRPAEDNDY